MPAGGVNYVLGIRVSAQEVFTKDWSTRLVDEHSDSEHGVGRIWIIATDFGGFFGESWKSGGSKESEGEEKSFHFVHKTIRAL